MQPIVLFDIIITIYIHFFISERINDISDEIKSQSNNTVVIYFIELKCHIIFPGKGSGMPFFSPREPTYLYTGKHCFSNVLITRGTETRRFSSDL